MLVTLFCARRSQASGFFMRERRLGEIAIFGRTTKKRKADSL